MKKKDTMITVSDDLLRWMNNKLYDMNRTPRELSIAVKYTNVYNLLKGKSRRIQISVLQKILKYLGHPEASNVSKLLEEEREEIKKEIQKIMRIGISYSDIAKELGCSRQYLHSAIEANVSTLVKLRELLDSVKSIAKQKLA